MMHCSAMDRPQKAINTTTQPQGPSKPKRLNEAKSLKDISLNNVVKQIIKITNESIINPILTQQKVSELLQNADGSVLNLISEQLFNRLKLPITNQLTQFPLITVPETEDYFVDNMQFDPSGNNCMVLKAHIQSDMKKKLIEIYTIPNFELVKKWKLYCDYTRYSPRGKFISANERSKKESKITLFNLGNDFNQIDIQLPAQTVYCFNPQENHLITCNKDGIVTLLDIATQKEITASTQISGNFFPLIEPIKNYIIALDADERNGKIQNIIVISENNNTIQQHILDVSMQELPSGYCDTALYPAKNLLALSSGDNLFIYDLETDQLLKQFHCDDFINDIAFHPSGTFVAVASQDWTARIWNIQEDTNESHGRVLSIEDARSIVRNVSFSPIADTVLSSDRSVRLWDISTPEPTLVSSVKETNDDAPIIICPNTEHGLLFAKSSAENIWFAPTSQLFDVQQIIWIYSAHWAKKSLKGEELKLYLENLNNMIDTLFVNKNISIKTLLHKIVSLS